MQNVERGDGGEVPAVRAIRPAHDIHARSFEFAVSLVTLYKSLDGRGQVARTLGLQLLRSGTSVGANLAEANAGQSKADFISKSSIALKEAREAHYWLRLLTRTNVIPTREGQALVAEADQIISILTAILRKSRSSSSRGIRPLPAFYTLHSAFFTHPHRSPR